jgi:NADH-quinone oxidoreductase subunit L
LISAIVFLPLIGALIAGIVALTTASKQASHYNPENDHPHGLPWADKVSQVVTCSLMLLSALLSIFTFVDVAIEGNATVVSMFTWVSSGTLTFDWALRVDTLTAVMLVVVTGVSSMVHVYSVGYMSHDPDAPRFMAYLSLFTFFMLMLVTADNLVQMFFGWEGVGLASYLLIGFWYKKPTANAAAIKAFVVNRVGDFGFALGIFGIFMLFGSISFEDIFASAAGKADATLYLFGGEFHAITILSLLLFVGAMGKSAQLGLHTWLPDAMEGPTPVSALIHAATMVTAGVFMVARLSPIIEYSDTALAVITLVGAATAFFAATVGCVQNDIKRVIAYSTCSQLGYMFFACGVSAYSAGVFHLMTHGFFKALLFLGAGSVIHAMSDEQDMRKMGGIWKKIKVTYILMWIGNLALAGVPIFAGFYSKDAILESAFAANSTVGMIAFWLGIAAALMTAFYSWRLLFMTFHGEPRCDDHTLAHVHESPPVMLIPLLPLALGALLAGWVAHGWFMDPSQMDAFWNGAIFVLKEAHPAVYEAHNVPTWVKVLPIFCGATGIAFAWLFYIKNPAIPGMIANRFQGIYQFLLNKWYWDELYDYIFVKPSFWFGRVFWKGGDGIIIDGGGPNGMAFLTRMASKGASRLQTGYVYHYAFAMLIGIVLLVSWYLLVKVG